MNQILRFARNGSASFIFFIVLFFFFPSFALADFTGKVIKVKDGDTLVVLYEDHIPVIVRLYAIDAPELKQAYGKEAKNFASTLAYDRTITVHEKGIDKYDRVLGELTLPDGRDFSEEMLKAGLAWHYTQYDRSQRLADLEQEARDAQRGLWADPNPIPPWDFRHEEDSEKEPGKIKNRVRQPRGHQPAAAD